MSAVVVLILAAVSMLIGTALNFSGDNVGAWHIFTIANIWGAVAYFEVIRK